MRRIKTCRFSLGMLLFLFFFSLNNVCMFSVYYTLFVFVCTKLSFFDNFPVK